ncbi:CRTAC1 family protein [Chengkuizengella marina]|uniref:CRTAC1 family protein n=1 Tax=Chengkuizengella marina TaxID=2507566 RepID=A0A6N9Q5B1_9BACL|nr:CRTAC1 family protein [Chengkuizengella marina]NBI29814.1 CRTAC1 family protein [Chengkuizengella marina]
MKVRNILYLLFSCILILAGCNTFSAGEKVDLNFNFKEVTEVANVKFNHEIPVFDEKVNNIMPWLASTGASVATGDYNNDGYMDLYFTNSKKGSLNILFQNNGDGSYTKVDSIVSDINQEGISSTALFLDYDNNGTSDLFVGFWGQSKLFKNNGDGTFTEVSEEAGVNLFSYAAKAITLDYDKDGFLDIYVGNYFRSENNLWDLKTTKIMHDDFEHARNGGFNQLYKNNGDGTFTEIAEQINLDDTGWTLATGSADVNHDGYPDIYNANDFGPDVLYINENGKKFKKIIQRNGIGLDTHKGMNADFVDIFHKGELGIYVSNVSKPTYIIEGNDFWYPNDEGQYENIAEELGLNFAGFSWGAKFFDTNNSGEFSLIVTNGFITGKSKDNYWFDLGTLATTPESIVEDTKNWPSIGKKDLSGNENKFLFLNLMQSNNGFENVALQAGIDFTEDGRGVSVVDLDNSGELDLVFANQGGKARVYKNQIEGNNWIKLSLQGVYPSNRDAIGARVTIVQGDKRTLIEKDGGNGFGGQSDPRIHFGIGERKKVDEIIIKWPSGRIQSLKNIEANQTLHIKENNNLPMEEGS